MAASTNLTPEQRSIRARIAAHARWAKEDPRTALAPVHAGLRARFRREVAERFPDLPAAELDRRGESAYRAHMQRLALASSKARGARKGGDGRT